MMPVLEDYSFTKEDGYYAVVKVSDVVPVHPFCKHLRNVEKLARTVLPNPYLPSVETSYDAQKSVVTFVFEDRKYYKHRYPK